MLQSNEKTSYPGGKAGSGVYQKIINLMPPHRVYVEGFLGGGSIMRIKRPATELNIGIEIDKAVYDAQTAAGLCVNRHDGKYMFLNTSFLKWLEYSDKQTNGPNTLIYLDPPYLMSTRSCKRPMYDHEFHTEAEHAALLSAILPLSARVIISGYASPLYDDMLATWRRIEFTGVSRGGPTTEVVWWNFAEPAELHDYRFLGDTFRQRQDIRRQKERWIAWLKNMPSQKRFAILAATEEFKSDRNGSFADSRSIIGTIADSRDAAELPSDIASADLPLSAGSVINAVAGSAKAK